MTAATTTWSGVTIHDTTWTTATPSGITTWSDNQLPLVVFAVPQCEILPPSSGPFLTDCEILPGSAPAQGGVPQCEDGENATYWNRVGRTETPYTTVTGNNTNWTRIL